MRTLKTILIMSMLMVLTVSCTDLTEDLVPNTKTENTEITTNQITNSVDTGEDGSQNDGGKGD